MSKQAEDKAPTEKPAPLETDLGEQQDDNIDDLGRKQDGSTQEQPSASEPDKR